MLVMDRDAIRKDIRSNFIVYAVLWFLPIAIKVSPALGIHSKLAENMPSLPISIALCSLALGVGIFIKYKGQDWI
jgi:hypothetical protein